MKAIKPQRYTSILSGKENINGSLTDALAL
jgi:hypothetical protein